MWASCFCDSQCVQFVKRVRKQREEYKKASELLHLMEKMKGCDDVTGAAGIELPAIYLTPTRRWLVLLVFCVLNAIASGPLTMFWVLEPILIREHVFSGHWQLAELTTLFSVTLGFIYLSYIILGILFDTFGPRWNAVVLTLLFAFCAMIIGCALYIRQCNWLLYIAYPCALMFSYGGNYGAYGWQWLLPESQNTVNSLVTATQALSDALVLVIVWLYKAYGLQLWTFFWLLAIYALFVASVNAFIVPSQQQHLSYAKAVQPLLVAKELSGLDAKELGELYQNYGSNGNGSNRKVDDVPIKTSGWRWWDNIKGVRNTFIKYPGINFMFVGGLCVFGTAIWIPMLQLYPFWANRFGVSTTEALLEDFALIYAIGAAICAVLVGRLCDSFGLNRTILFAMALSIVSAVALAMPTISSQWVYMVCFTVEVSVVIVVAYRFCMLYAPVQLFGCYGGIILVCMGVWLIVVTTLVSIVQVSLGRSASEKKDDEVKIVVSLVCFFTFLQVLLFGGVLFHWMWYPPPDVGSISCRDAGIPEEEAYESHEGKGESEC